MSNGTQSMMKRNISCNQRRQITIISVLNLTWIFGHSTMPRCGQLKNMLLMRQLGLEFSVEPTFNLSVLIWRSKFHGAVPWMQSWKMSALAVSVRLVMGDHSNGILQVYSRYRYRTVCGTGFDNADAAVACKDLGFQHGRALPTGMVHVHFLDELPVTYLVHFLFSI